MGIKTARPGTVSRRRAPGPDRLAAVAPAFENKAGHYELLRIEGDRAYYSFTNHQGHRTDAEMALMSWRRLQEKVQGVPTILLVAFVLAGAVPYVAAQTSAKLPARAAIYPEDVPTQSITLPGNRANPQPQEAHAEKSPAPSQSGPAAEILAASAALNPSSGDPNAELHYRTALLALSHEDLPVAAEEMSEAAKAAPQNALVLYGLAVIQARNRQPESGLSNMENALHLGLPGPEAARAPGLLASMRYAIKKNEDEQKKVTPLKLWGSYDSALDSPSQEFVDRSGRTIFRIKTPISREMFLWKVDGENTVRGHWLEKNTLTEETIYPDPKRHDPKPKTTTEEHWWLVSILINPDGSLDGSRMETCTRESGFGCEEQIPRHGKVITFKGHVEPNGDITLTQGDANQALLLRKKSKVASAPPADVHIDVD